MHSNTIVSILGLAASVSAHVRMNTPKGWEVDNSPLEKDGSNFPCKGVTYDSSVPATQMNKGEQQPMRFTGSAVHGGGSCQVSLTTDTEPTKDSVWKVIKSFEGGCPAQGVDGNYGENANMELPDTYNFVIPEDVPDGKYTLAWTWFNKVGNREMYMNCAPIEATGGGGDESAFAALPDMFTANIYGDGVCETEEGFDLKFPDAGEFVEQLGSGKPKPFSGTGCPATNGGSGGGSSGGDSGGDYNNGGSSGGDAGDDYTGGSGSGDGSSGGDSGGDYNGGSSGGDAGGDYTGGSGSGETAPTESSAPEPSAPVDGGIFAPIDGSTGSPPSGSAGSGSPTPTGAGEAPAESSAASSPVESGEHGGDDGSYQPEQPSPTTGGEESGAGGSYGDSPSASALPSQEVPANGSQEDGSGSGSDSGSSAAGYEAGSDCGERNGVWNCIDGTSYQRCASGVWSVVMQLSEGTECTPGEGDNIQMVRKRGTTRFGAKFLLL